MVSRISHSCPFPALTSPCYLGTSITISLAFPIIIFMGLYVQSCLRYAFLSNIHAQHIIHDKIGLVQLDGFRAKFYASSPAQIFLVPSSYTVRVVCIILQLSDSRSLQAAMKRPYAICIVFIAITLSGHAGGIICHRAVPYVSRLFATRCSAQR